MQNVAKICEINWKIFNAVEDIFNQIVKNFPALQKLSRKSQKLFPSKLSILLIQLSKKIHPENLKH